VVVVQQEEGERGRKDECGGRRKRKEGRNEEVRLGSTVCWMRTRVR
jgi:hypothetical protein